MKTKDHIYVYTHMVYKAEQIAKKKKQINEIRYCNFTTKHLATIHDKPRVMVRMYKLRH